MRVALVLLTTILAPGFAAGLTAPALADDAGSSVDTVIVEANTADTAADTPIVLDEVPCGCGGPKALYAAKYGTVQPPALQEQARQAAEATSDPAGDAAEDSVE